MAILISVATILVLLLSALKYNLIKMNIILKISFVLFLFNLNIGVGHAQEKKPKKIHISGVVTNVNKVPLKGVMIFVDSLNISETTNKKGQYKFKLKSKPKNITVYTPQYGVVVAEYSGEKTLDFIFPVDSKAISIDSLVSKGYMLKSKEIDTSWYAQYSTIIEILKHRFQSVHVIDGVVYIRGVNSFNGDKDPLILVDGVRRDFSALHTIPTAEVKLIRVVKNGSDAATYGSFKANNGVILITMKK